MHSVRMTYSRRHFVMYFGHSKKSFMSLLPITLMHLSLLFQFKTFKMKNEFIAFPCNFGTLCQAMTHHKSKRKKISYFQGIRRNWPRNTVILCHVIKLCGALFEYRVKILENVIVNWREWTIWNRKNLVIQKYDHLFIFIKLIIVVIHF